MKILRHVTHLKKEKLVLSIALLLASHHSWAMVQFIPGAAATALAGAYMAPRCLQELQKAQSADARDREAWGRLGAQLQANADIDQAVAMCTNLLNDLSGKPATARALNDEERAIRYGIQEARIFGDRWGRTIGWGVGTALVAGVGISLMHNGAAESNAACFTAAAASGIAAAALAVKSAPLAKRYLSLNSRINNCLQQESVLEKDIRNMQTLLDNRKKERNRKAGAFDQLKNALVGDAHEDFYTAQLKGLAKRVQQSAQEKSWINQEKNKILPQLGLYAMGAVGCGAAGLNFLYKASLKN